MTKAQLAKAFNVAKSDADVSNEDISIFDGFGLNGFLPVYCTIGQLARLIRWQCQYMNGEWDMEEFQVIAYFGKKRFMILECDND